MLQKITLLSDGTLCGLVNTNMSVEPAVSILALLFWPEEELLLLLLLFI
jgi:uncharacterized membrane protein YjfL (UPF0719 family)